MCRLFPGILVGLLAVGGLAHGQGEDVSRVLAAAREALGGDAKLTAVRTFTAIGQSTRSLGQFQMSGDVELACELPDKYVRKENLSMGPAAMTRTTGFNGVGLIQENSSAPMLGPGEGHGVRFVIGPCCTGPQATPEQIAGAKKMALIAAKQDFARLTLGLFASSFEGYPLHFTYAGTAESGDGKADMIDVTGADDFASRLFIDTQTHLPLMLTWQGPELRIATQVMRRGEQAPPAPTQPAGDASQAATMVEYRLYFADYRDVGGIKVPFRMSGTIGGKPTEELTFDKFKVNPKLDAKTFEISR